MSNVKRRSFLKLSAALPMVAGTASIAGFAAKPANSEEISKPYGLPISSDFPFEKKRIALNGSEIAYVDEGDGQPILFLHGNPTSSYLWRNVIPHVSQNYRVIAPDLIGMGDSGKPDIDYTLRDHETYIDQFIEQLDLRNIILVVHDWGSVLGMRYARLNPARVSALAFMEAIIPPAMPAPSYEAMGPQVGEMFKNLRTPGVGEEMVLENNFFVEEILPKFGVLRPLSEAEMNAYRKPFQTPESRKPTLQWPREIPIGGSPSYSVSQVVENGKWLLQSEIPKLLFYVEPGAILPKPAIEFLIKNTKNLEARFLGAGLHFVQEDHPHLIGQGLADWLRRTS